MNTSIHETLIGKSRTELEDILQNIGQPTYRVEQLWQAMYKHRVNSFAEVTGWPRLLQQKMAERFSVLHVQPANVRHSTDGTRKYLFKGHDGKAFEAVYIPEVAKGRKTNTLCISSQTGCAVGCRFCFTATVRPWRDLTPGEIVGQVLAVQRELEPLPADELGVRNIVFMGMGEPLLNYDNVLQAVRILLDTHGFDFSGRRITISTSGIVPRMRQLGHDLPTQLAVSLNATTDEIRTRIMPINKKWPLAELIGAMRDYPLRPRRRITVEYVMLRDINDSIEDAHRLAELLHDIPVKINLLPLNQHEKTEFSTPSPERVDKFQKTLLLLGYNAWIRTARGQDVNAACGQLGGQATAQLELAS